MKNYLKIFIILLVVITLTIVCFWGYNRLTTYTFSVNENILIANVRIYREAGKSYLEFSRINNEKYKFPLAKEVETHGGVNIFDDKRFVIITLKEIREINTEEAFTEKWFNSYQLHEANSNLIKHIKAVKQLKKDKLNCIDWY